jgi:nitroimidazol reductase NimA-like FMN-containing flavoprotein (pyridoxamine 5'-phosphate oxidase superfamily)
MPARRDLIEMTPEEIRAYLLSQRRLIIVSNGPDGFPHPMPMNFIIDEQDRYLITTFRKSQKVKNFERDPKAALLVESGLAYDEMK